MVPDFVWYLWATGRIPAQLGRHDVDVPLPERCSNMVGGPCYHVHAVRATVEVVGLVATLVGTAHQHALAQAHDARVDRFKLGVTFNPSQPPSAIRVFPSEDALQAYVEGSAAIRVTHRVKVPRIRFEMGYWPPSARVLHHVTERMKAFEAGTLPDSRPFTFEDLEGYDIRTAWESIADNDAGVPPEE